tara:strand:- start:980 stop:2347 length:1368 start_codon:yes stop_codon:yes gene_type:complete
MKSFSQFIEQTDDFTGKQRKDNIDMLNKLFGTEDKAKETAKKVKNTQNISNTKEKRRQENLIKKNTKKGEEVLNKINKLTEPDAPSTQLSGRTKEQIFRDAESKRTADEGEFKTNKNTNTKRNVVNREIQKTRPGKSKKVTVGALDKRDASIKKLDDVVIKPKTGDVDKTKKLLSDMEKNITKPKEGEIQQAKKIVKKLGFKTNKNTTNNTVKTNQKVNKVTQSKIDLKPNQKQLRNTDLDNKTSKRTPRRISKTIKPINYTTQGRGLGATLQRGLERTGLVDPIPQKEVKGKLKPITKTDLKNTKLKTDIAKKTPKGLKAVRGLSTLGRIAGGAFAVQDFLSTAKREKAMGRGKTAARLAGLSKALGGYVGGGIGATLGAGVASLPGGIAGGAAGYHYGSKLGDKVYQTGRDLVTGKKTFKQLRKDINKGAGNLYKGAKSIPGKIDKYFDPSQR